METIVDAHAQKHSRLSCIGSVFFGMAFVVLLVWTSSARGMEPIPEAGPNLLVDAEVSGNLDSFNKGLRGQVRDMIFDHHIGAFVNPSQWHEYGVGFNQDLGVVPEDKPAWWMAEWPQPVEANLILLSGTYDNQPQEDTGWKIELRRDGQWTTHARGVGGWYDRGHYTWGGPDTEPLTFDGLRGSVFSPDDKTPVRSIHFRGEAHRSWIVAFCPPENGVEARIAPLTESVVVGRPMTFDAGGSKGEIAEYRWDFGDGTQAKDSRVEHTFSEPGLYNVTLTVSDGAREHDCLALVRAHTEHTVRLPQLLLDTDAKNEQDDQHYIGYALFSELDILGINSVHHGGGQEPVNYAEILHIINLSLHSGLPRSRVPLVYRGADRRLDVPQSGQWHDTEPIPSDASKAILAAARGASPENPVWIVPVGPGTNVASAILQARREDLELKDRMRIMWLGGSNNEIINEFNGNNDPWSMYVVCQSGVETWIMPAPVGGRVSIDKRGEGHLYADNPLGRYLRSIVPARNKALYDASCISAILCKHLDLGWVKQSDPVVVAGPQGGYRWTRTDEPTPVRVIRQIDQEAMKLDLFNTLKGQPTRLIETRSAVP